VIHWLNYKWADVSPGGIYNVSVQATDPAGNWVAAS